MAVEQVDKTSIEEYDADDASTKAGSAVDTDEDTELCDTESDEIDTLDGTLAPGGTSAQPEVGDDGVASLDVAQMEDVELMGSGCQAETRISEQWVGNCCANDVKRLYSDAKRNREQKQAFARCRKLGSQTFIDIVIQMKARNAANHRQRVREPFDFVSHILFKEVTTMIHTGTESQWMNETLFVALIRTVEDLTEGQAKTQFQVELENLPQSLVRKHSRQIL